MLADEGVYVVKFDLNNTQSNIICLKSNAELENDDYDERIYDVSIIPGSNNFDHIVTVLTNIKMYFFEDFK